METQKSNRNFSYKSLVGGTDVLERTTNSEDLCQKPIIFVVNKKVHMLWFVICDVIFRPYLQSMLSGF